jgi:hypothetical protein
MALSNYTLILAGLAADRPASPVQTGQTFFATGRQSEAVVVVTRSLSTGSPSWTPTSTTRHPQRPQVTPT